MDRPAPTRPSEHNDTGNSCSDFESESLLVELETALTGCSFKVPGPQSHAEGHAEGHAEALVTARGLDDTLNMRESSLVRRVDAALVGLDMAMRNHLHEMLSSYDQTVKAMMSRMASEKRLILRAEVRRAVSDHLLCSVPPPPVSAGARRASASPSVTASAASASACAPSTPSTPSMPSMASRAPPSVAPPSVNLSGANAAPHHDGPHPVSQGSLRAALANSHHFHHLATPPPPPPATAAHWRDNALLPWRACFGLHPRR